MTKRKILSSIISRTAIGVIVTVAVSIILLNKGLAYAIVFAVLGLIVTIICAKTYLIFAVNKTTSGVITDISVKVYINRVRPAGDKMYSPIISENYPAYDSYDEKVLILTIEKQNGKRIDKTFPFDEYTDQLEIGDTIEFSRFDNRPTVILKKSTNDI